MEFESLLLFISSGKNISYEYRNSNLTFRMKTVSYNELFLLRIDFLELTKHYEKKCELINANFVRNYSF